MDTLQLRKKIENRIQRGAYSNTNTAYIAMWRELAQAWQDSPLRCKYDADSYRELALNDLQSVRTTEGIALYILGRKIQLLSELIALLDVLLDTVE